MRYMGSVPTEPGERFVHVDGACLRASAVDALSRTVAGLTRVYLRGGGTVDVRGTDIVALQEALWPTYSGAQ